MQPNLSIDDGYDEPDTFNLVSTKSSRARRRLYLPTESTFAKENILTYE